MDGKKELSMVCGEEGFMLYAEQHLNDDSNFFFFHDSSHINKKQLFKGES